jgi:hypothetical protein
MFARINKQNNDFDLGAIVFYTLLTILTATLIAISIGTTIFVIYVAEYFNLTTITSDFLNNQIVRKMSFYSVVGWITITWMYNYFTN